MKILTLFQIIISCLMVVTVILQTRGTQTGVAFGSGSETYRSKKGIERMLFYATIVLAVLFASTSILSLVLR